MNIGQHCRQAVIGIDEGCTLREAALLMREKHVGALVVTTAVANQRDAVGVVTDRDIADAVAAHGLSPAEVLVGAVATTAALHPRDGQPGRRRIRDAPRRRPAPAARRRRGGRGRPRLGR